MANISAPNEPVAIVGVAAIMPQAPDGEAFWNNIKQGRYCITEVPAERWDPALYFSEDHSAPDKTYSKIGGWVREFAWDPIKWKLPVPPKVAEQMDIGQRWAVSAARAALADAGWPGWKIDSERVAVILGNAIGGEKHYRTNMRIELPEVLRELAGAPSFAALPDGVREHIMGETRNAFLSRTQEINEDTMPGELSNVMAGRIANLFNFRGPNFTTDAACASGLAAMSTAIEGLIDRRYDAVVTGGVDRNMGVAAFVKFCKIGALSATGTRPFDAGADGFVMGEGAALFVLKRLEDAERDGDKIYAVILGIAGSSDGKGKGITAPNPVGQKLAVSRAWDLANVDPGTVSAVEAHGTSTRVGDAAELETLNTVFGAAGAKPRSVALGSVKSNIGHLKAAAGTAGLFKMARSLHEKVLAPSLNFKDPNPNVDWDKSAFKVNTQLREWPMPECGIRRGGVSAFGFGGTNFHVALEEYVPGRHKGESRLFSMGQPAAAPAPAPAAAPAAGGVPSARILVDVPFEPNKPPLRGALVLGGRDDADLVAQLTRVVAEAKGGKAPPPTRPDPSIGSAAVRAAIDYADAKELAAKGEKLIGALKSGNQAVFRMLRPAGVFVGRGPAPKVAFLYTGQGSQYANMLGELRSRDRLVDETFAAADIVMTPLLGRPLSSYIFIDTTDEKAMAKLENELRQTEITQPALLATDSGLHRLLGSYGIRPDMVMGHSLGEYGALIAAGSLTFDAALEAVSARGREMANLSVADNGAMAAVFGPIEQIQQIVDRTPGYCVIANINSTTQAVVGGSTPSVTAAVEQFIAVGMQATRIPVSHAFHTSIVAPAAEPLKVTLRRLNVQPPRLPLVANVTGDFYPADATVDTMIEVLGKQVASPVQFVKGLRTLYGAGARVFVEIGPKRALHGFVEDVLGAHDDVLALFTNHPKQGDIGAFNQALCALWAFGLGFGNTGVKAKPAPTVVSAPPAAAVAAPRPAALAPVAAAAPAPAPAAYAPSADDARLMHLGRVFADAIAEGMRLYGGVPGAPAGAALALPGVAPVVAGVAAEPVVITGAALGLPGVDRVFDDANIGRILGGQQMITAVPDAIRRRMASMHITRLVKNEIGGATFESIDDPADVVKLAGRHAPFDVIREFGIDTARDEALDSTTRLAIGVGFDALRDAGIPLVMHYKTTTIGTKLPDRWGLPEAMRDDTGIIFASAFPGYDRFASELEAYAADRARREHLLALEGVRVNMAPGAPGRSGVDRLIDSLRHEIEDHPYVFDRRFLFRVLAMGHSQFAEIIGARGPNTQINAACASTTQALSIAEDWIRAGRCRRVIVVSADDITNDTMMPWFGSGFLATGAAATDAKVEDAATPFDRRRHGMIVGMGAAAFIVESAGAARERGIQPICEVLGAVIANSAYHGTRLDLDHIGAAMEALVREAEARGERREAMAGETVFVSHETYTPARGGSASAEIHALRRVFGPGADRIVITNTKGFTGHAMGAGIEDAVAIKVLETGIVPPVPNYREPDPELGTLNLSRGGQHPIRYALRLAAGFGSQLAMSLLRWTPMPDGQHRSPDALGYAYRIVNRSAWQSWLDGLSGQTGAVVEVDHRRLRIVDRGAPATAPREAEVKVPYAGQLQRGVVAAAPAAVAAPVAAPAAPKAAVAAPVAPARPAALVAPVAKPAPAPAPVAPAITVDAVLAQVTSIVSKMTGYPVDLLDPDLDLEADLGVDTVKQAEVFAAVREHYNVERDPNLKLRDFPTLRHVAGWVRDKANLGSAPAAAAAVAAAAPAAATVSTDDVLAQVTAIVSKMTGYPSDLLDPDLDLEADLGVDTVKQAEVFAAVREHYNVERDPNLKLRDFPTLRHVAGWVRDKANLGAAPAAVPAQAAAVAAAPAAAVPVAAAADAVLAQVTAIVAQMTGYPSDLLDPDLDLEADLGVDTVKQAEVFAAVREHYQVERDPNLKLRDFPTLRHVAGWVRDKAGLGAAPTAAAAQAAVAAAPVAAAPAAAAAAPAAAADDVIAQVTAIVAQMTGYPAELLDPDLDLEADLGVDTVKQAEVFAAVREHYNVERDPNLKLRDFPTLRHVAGWVRDKAGLGAAPTAAAAPAAAVAAAAVAAVPVAAAPAAPADDVIAQVTAIISSMTGYPAELLDPDLDLEADLGVDTVKQAEVFAAVRTHYNVERDPNLKLRDFPTLRHVANWVRERAGLGAAPAAAVAPAAVEAPAAEAPAAAAAAAAPADDVIVQVTAIISNMTGYPAELLDPDLDLEADLGVDTVKQAEVFAAVRTHYNVERDPNLKLRDFPTLRHVANWVRERAGLGGGGAGAAAPASAPAAEAAPAAPRAALVQGDLRAVDALPRRLPTPSLRPAAAACVATGVNLEGARVVVMNDEGGVGKALSKRLTKAGATVLGFEAGVATDELLSVLENWRQEGPIAGVYWLPGLDAEGDLLSMDIGGWHEVLRRRVQTLYATMRALYETGPFLVTGTRLGGLHGYDPAGATNPAGGAVTGFAKSYKKEKPDSLVKAADFGDGVKASAIADALIEETLNDPGCVEIGRYEGRRFGVAFVETPFPALGEDGQPVPGAGMTLNRDSVFVVTGAAGSIVSAITADLAAVSGGSFHLLDLTPTPDRDDADLATFRTNRESLKPKIAERMKAAGERPTPVAIEKELARMERLDAALAAIQAVEAAGGTAYYHSVNLTDAAGVQAVMADIASRHGKVDVLLHAAGLEISRNLPEKQPAEFDLVLGVKADGWFNLLKGAGDMPIGATVVFSSVAGRFGNQGQTDYSSANDLLCKYSSYFRRSRPATRALALDWTAWGGIGMATRGSIPKIMEMAGVQMLPPEAGVAWIRRELLSGEARGEVIVAGVLGMMAAEMHASGGVDPASLLGNAPRGPMIGQASLSVHDGLVVRTTLDPKQQPFLFDHRIDGIPVLPAVMGMEGFAEAAQVLAPDLRVIAVEDANFAAPLKFYRDEARELVLQVVTVPDGEELVAHARLVAERTLAGQTQPQRTVHFTGKVRLGTKSPAAQKEAQVVQGDNAAIGKEQVYTFYFHGPAYQVVGTAWRSGDESMAAMTNPLPDNHVPAEAPLATAPRLAELCFQTAGLWQAGIEDRLALPMRVGRMSMLRDPAKANGELFCVARQVAEGSFDSWVVDAKGQVYVKLEGYRTVPLPSAIPEAVANVLHATYRR